MRHFAISLAVLTCVLFTVPVHAQSTHTGNDMLRAFYDCNEADNRTAAGVAAFRSCMVLEGYIDGVFEASEFVDASGLINDIFDPPDGIKTGQVYDVVRRYLEAHPENRQAPAIELTILAFKTAWPPKKRP